MSKLVTVTPAARTKVAKEAVKRSGFQIVVTPELLRKVSGSAHAGAAVSRRTVRRAS
jgi:hypothetical protein